MRAFQFMNIFLVLMLLLVGATPARAGSGGFCSDISSTTPADAAVALRGSLPSGTSLGGAAQSILISAFETAAEKNPGYIVEVGSLIAIGRPDTIDALRQSVHRICVANAELIWNKILLALQNPTAEQLAAIASADGVSPAAGEDGDGSGG